MGKQRTGTTEITLPVTADLLRKLDREAQRLNEGVGAHGRRATPEYAALRLIRESLGLERRSAADGVGPNVGGAKPVGDG